jgi:hypothetical protein
MGASAGLPNIAVHDLKAAGSRLVAFSHGRGSFELVSFDLNNDSVVNCADLNVVKSSINKRAGDAGFDPQADLNNDSIVDVRDIRMMALQLPSGTVCP